MSLLKTDQIYLQFYVFGLDSITVTPWTKRAPAVFSLIVLHKDGETPHSDIQRNRIVVRLASVVILSGRNIVKT